MKLERFYIVNANTKQVGLFEASDVFDHNGAVIAYGTTGAQPLWLPSTRGRWVEEARPSCPVLLPGVPTEVIERFHEAVDGRPLYGVEEYSQLMAFLNGGAIRAVPLVNMARVEGIGKPGMSKDAMLERAYQLVEIFRAFQENGGMLPVHVRLLMARQAAGRPETPDGPAFGGRDYFTGLGGAA